MKFRTIPNCKGTYKCKGLCVNHYENLRRTGNALGIRNGERGKEYTNDSGYRVKIIDRVPRRVHVLIVEEILGRKLPSHIEIHHVNGDRSDNRNENLVVCDSHAYHFLLHRRQKALDQCGNPNYRRCGFCNFTRIAGMNTRETDAS